jgi:hypothetical protein
MSLLVKDRPIAPRGAAGIMEIALVVIVSLRLVAFVRGPDAGAVLGTHSCCTAWAAAVSPVTARRFAFTGLIFA